MELTIAGGLLASGCGLDGPRTPMCNANPDPCCFDASSQACIDYKNRDMTVAIAPDDLSSHD